MPLQKSSGSVRERWIKALLPASIVVAAYMIVMNTGNTRELRALEVELQRERDDAVTVDELASLDAQLRSAAKERDQLNEQIDAVQQDIEERLAEFRFSSAAEQIVQIGNLCQTLSIALLSQQPSSNLEVSELRTESIATLRKLIPDRELTFRQLELAGRYQEMAVLLEKLPKTIGGVVPVGVELLEKDQEDSEQLASGERRWRLHLLM